MVTLHSATRLLPKSCFQRQFFIQEIMILLHSATRLLLENCFQRHVLFFSFFYSRDHGYTAQCLPESGGSLLSSCLAAASSAERTLKTSNQSNFVGCLLCICF